MSEIDEKTQLHSGGVQVVDHLRAMFVDEMRKSFELNDNLAVADEIRFQRTLDKSVP